MAVLNASAQVVLENDAMRLVLGEDGTARSLVCKSTGEECLESPGPLCAITQYRPYDNENFLMMPAKSVTFPSNRLEMRDGQLFVEFKDTYDIAVIDVTLESDYMAFRLARRDYRIEDMGVKRKTEVDELALVMLNIRDREHFGSWLNAVWDSSTAVCLMGADPKTRIDRFGSTMYAGLDHSVGFSSRGAVLIASATEGFLDAIDHAERDFGMPRGVQSRRSERYNRSYYELRDVTPENLGKHLDYARRGGFGAIVIYYTDFASTCGHYLWKDGFDMSVLKDICRRIRGEGFDLGFHIHYSKVSVTDPYINSGIPDNRMNYVGSLTLARELSPEDKEIFLESNPGRLRLEAGRRLVRIDDELIMYEGFSTEAPYRLYGCERGVYNSKAARHGKGSAARQPDVDDWPLFIRIDQESAIQDEIAGRLAEIYNECGFNFLYYDGAEDVPFPYWYNVSRSQQAVYDRLEDKPIYCEGALKSHWGWHILSRGNAFDLFRPEKIRPAYRKYTLRCAKAIADDFTSVDFGWTDYLAPDESTIGMQPDILEYICSKALAWNSPISLMGKLPALDSHPRTEDNLRVIRDWERAKTEGLLGEKDIQRLREPESEWMLLGGRIYPAQQLTPDNGDSPVRAFLIEKEGRNCLVYWHMSGSGKMRLRIRGKVALRDMDGNDVPFSRSGSSLTLPLGGRLVLETDLGKEELIQSFRERKL